MPVLNAILGAALYAVHPIAIPAGMSVPIAPTQYQSLWDPPAYRRPTTFTLARGGTIAAIVHPDGGGADRVLVVRPNGTRTILPPLPDALIGQRIGSYAVSREGRRTSGSGRLQNVALADDGTVIVTFAFPFSGGYGGLYEASFAWSGRSWSDLLPSDLPGGAVNVWVAGASRSSIALVRDFLDQSPSSMQTDEASGVHLQSAVEVLRDGALTEVGHGIATGLAGSFVSGYDAGFRPSSQGAFHRATTRALVWTANRPRALGPGIAWAVNTGGIAAGDNRRSPASPGRPVSWRDGRTIALSPRRGSAFAIDDGGTIVGTVEDGGFVVFPNDKSNSARLLDGLLQDRRWHVSAAYRISANGSILALGTRAGAASSLMILEPVRS